MLQFLAIWLPLRQDDKISSHGQQIQIHNVFSFQANASVRCQYVDSSSCRFHFLLATVGPLLPVLVTSLDNI